MTTFSQPNALKLFKDAVKGRRLYLLFYSASLEPTAKVFCVEISLEAFEMLLIGHKVKSFEAEFDHVVTIENIIV
ncbi:hypothetical protein FAM09_24690 [Niastella caeni]|uniref:Uncharacterized protein n=1 Tax=Niastella caeni TaxID=2569763 RepID=A0A4S8HGE4_9BACT|nr:hypothetical protein [Niastella caeni]THU34220.1 hypothetical protein FAM09_24690 [Niastella caeni]